MRKNSWLFVLLLCGVVTSTSCLLSLNSIRGSGNLESIELSEKGFSSLDLSHGCKGTITQADEYSVRVEIDDNLADYLEVERNGDTLAIGLESMRSYTRVSLHVEIGMPEIENLDLSGGSDIVITGFSSDKAVSLDLSGGSEINGDLISASLAIDLSGGSEVELQGSSQNARLEGSGGSTFAMEEYQLGDVEVDLSGGSSANVNLSGTLYGDLSGGSSVYYLGNPTLGTISTSGGARVVRK